MDRGHASGGRYADQRGFGHRKRQRDVPGSANGGGDHSSSFTIAEQTFTIEQSAASISGLAAAGSLGQVASEGTWDFSLIGINLGTSAATARFSFADNNGSPLMLPLTFPQSPPAAGPELASTLDRTLNPNAQIVMESTGPDSAAHTGRLGASVEQRQRERVRDLLQSEGSLERRGAARNPQREQIYSGVRQHRPAHNGRGGRQSGGATAERTGDHPGRYGNADRQYSGDLAERAGARLFHAEPDRYPATKGKRGTIEFDTPPGGQISVLGLRANGPALTTLAGAGERRHQRRLHHARGL